VYPYTARAYYAINRGWITTTYFDDRIFAVDALTNNYINWIGFVRGSYIVIGLPFKLSEEQLSVINETLEYFGYELVDARVDK